MLTIAIGHVLYRMDKCDYFAAPQNLATARPLTLHEISYFLPSRLPRSLNLFTRPSPSLHRFEMMFARLSSRLTGRANSLKESLQGWGRWEADMHEPGCTIIRGFISNSLGEDVYTFIPSLYSLFLGSMVLDTHFEFLLSILCCSLVIHYIQSSTSHNSFSGASWTPYRLSFTPYHRHYVAISVGNLLSACLSTKCYRTRTSTGPPLCCKSPIREAGRRFGP